MSSGLENAVPPSCWQRELLDGSEDGRLKLIKELNRVPQRASSSTRRTLIESHIRDRTLTLAEVNGRGQFARPHI